jgi:hypothetical protein
VNACSERRGCDTEAFGAATRTIRSGGPTPHRGQPCSSRSSSAKRLARQARSRKDDPGILEAALRLRSRARRATFAQDHPSRGVAPEASPPSAGARDGRACLPP